MKLRKALSLTALLAGAGLGLAQETPTEMATVPSGKPTTLVDSIRRTGGYQQVQPTAPTTAAPAGTSTTMLPTQGEYCYGNGYGSGHSFYGGLDYLLYQVGATFRSHGTDRLPSYRSEMPYGFVFRSLTITTGGGGQNVATNQIGSLVGTAQITPFIFSGNNLDATDRNGFRLTLGMVLDAAEEISVEGRYFQVERRPVSFLGAANGSFAYSPGGFENVIIEPGSDPTTEQTAFSAGVSALIVGESSNSLKGLDFNCVKTAGYVGTIRFSWLTGLRYIDFEENQNLSQTLGFTNQVYIFEPSTTNLQAQADARNQFLGGQVGGRFEGTIGSFFVSGNAMVAVGGMRHETSYNETVSNAAGVDLTPVYPFPTSTSQSRTRLTFVPEFQGSVGYMFTDFCRLSVGYDLLFIRRIVRPNGSSTPAGIASVAGGTVTDLGFTQASRGPNANFGEENLVAHGWRIGLELRY